MDTPPLVTPRLALRRYRAEDFDFFAYLLGRDEVTRYSSSGRLSREQARALFDKIFPIYRDGKFAIWCVTQGAVPIGHAELKPRAGEAGLELVYFLDVAHWRKGYGTELVQALVAYGETLSPRLLATVDPDNAPSIRLLQKAGFVFYKREEEPTGPCSYYERVR